MSDKLLVVTANGYASLTPLPPQWWARPHHSVSITVGSLFVATPETGPVVACMTVGALDDVEFTSLAARTCRLEVWCGRGVRRVLEMPAGDTLAKVVRYVDPDNILQGDIGAPVH